MEQPTEEKELTTKEWFALLGIVFLSGLIGFWLGLRTAPKVIGPVTMCTGTINKEIARLHPSSNGVTENVVLPPPLFDTDKKNPLWKSCDELKGFYLTASATKQPIACVTSEGKIYYPINDSWSENFATTTISALRCVVVGKKPKYADKELSQ